MHEILDLDLIKYQIELTLMGITGFNPAVSKSTKWKTWKTNITMTTCEDCLSNNGKVFNDEYPIEKLPPLHYNCRCVIMALSAIQAGTATFLKEKGADYTMKYFGKLPEEYVDKETAREAGWLNKKGNLRNVLPNTTIGGDVYFNRNKHLPTAPGRIWYEADINYAGGYRNTCRIVYSNDGLIFATYDHFETFYEII